MLIRPERPADFTAIAQLVLAAFQGHPHSQQREPELIQGLRATGGLTLALVAEVDQEVVGHIAFSPVLIGGADRGWQALAPLAVRPDRQGVGVGAALVRQGLTEIQERGAAGCLLVGDPGYYGRFGFGAHPQLHMEGVPPQYVLALAWDGPVPAGAAQHHPAFLAVM